MESTTGPSPTLLADLTYPILIVWSIKNNAAEPMRVGRPRISRPAMPMDGAFRRHPPRIELLPHEKWWGEKKHNITGIFTPISADTTASRCSRAVTDSTQQDVIESPRRLRTR